jgi:hypothetical protein
MVALGRTRKPSPWPRTVPVRRRRRMERSPALGARLLPAAARPAREREPTVGCMPARVAAPAGPGRDRRACATRSPRRASGSRCAAATPAAFRVRDRGLASYDPSEAADRRSPYPRSDWRHFRPGESDAWTALVIHTATTGLRPRRELARRRAPTLAPPPSRPLPHARRCCLPGRESPPRQLAIWASAAAGTPDPCQSA